MRRMVQADPDPSGDNNDVEISRNRIAPADSAARDSNNNIRREIHRVLGYPLNRYSAISAAH